GISNALTCDFGMSPRLLPEPDVPVARMNTPGEPAPWLHPHPSQQGLLSYYEPVRQRVHATVLSAPVSALTRSLSPALGFIPTGGQCRHPPSHVPCKSRRPGSRRLHAGHRLANKT